MSAPLFRQSVPSFSSTMERVGQQPLNRLDLRGFRDLVDHELTATTASSSVMSTNEPANAAPKSARHAHERQLRTAMCVRSVRAHGHQQHELRRLAPQQPEVRATSGGLPCRPRQIGPRSVDGGSVSDSQADSAGSIPVTRSKHEKWCHSWGFVNSILCPPSSGHIKKRR